ncbi:MAG: DUF4124 domain-containing protein [Betaproteobacteria bacterium]|nr:MAG: DUF4124 domain-containing protein [Betaproteobacteria bacterium]TMG78213.1 MAG: DUF4124 domain-containing protein [Betaproteobacteria bacterium]
MILCLLSSVKRNSKLFRALLHFLLFMATAVPALAQVYKWVDENGVTHYGERPPQGRNATEVPNKLGSPGGAPVRPDTAKQNNPGQADAAAGRQGQETSARREEQCNQQRELLARLKQSPQNTAEHYGAIARQQKIVAEQCKG